MCIFKRMCVFKKRMCMHHSGPAGRGPGPLTIMRAHPHMLCIFFKILFSVDLVLISDLILLFSSADFAQAQSLC